jgi:uncharacterized protein YndB with AHSA1/START domain
MADVASATENEIAITRFYDAPVQLVWDAWTDPDQVARWWGPRGFTLTTHSKDLRAGGSWVYTMHGPDGVDYPNITRYIEVEPGRRLVYDHGASEGKPPLFRVTVVFTDVKGGTRMDMRMAFTGPEALREAKNVIRNAGGNSTWDRLAEYLESERSGRDIFVFNHTVDAPIDRVFDAWTDRALLSRWLAPASSDLRFIECDVRPGGRSIFSVAGNGAAFRGRSSYLEVERPHRLVYTQEFCDEGGNIARHPLAPVWPDTLLASVELTAESPNRTRVTVTWEVHGSATQEEHAAFAGSKAGMTRGWMESFDRLEAALE